MGKELRQAPEELNFIAYVTAEIAKDNYEHSAVLFMKGLERLIVAHTTITSDQFEYHVAAPLNALIRYKLQQNTLASESTVNAKQREQLNCSFCGKNESQVTQLIAGPGVLICDACVGICNEILEKISTTNKE